MQGGRKMAQYMTRTTVMLQIVTGRFMPGTASAIGSRLCRLVTMLNRRHMMVVLIMANLIGGFSMRRRHPARNLPAKAGRQHGGQHD